MSGQTIWLCCGVLRGEIETLRREEKIGGSLLFLDSMLHMTPHRLEKELELALNKAESPGRVVLVYGDCCPKMREVAERFKASRVRAINCAQMLLGKKRYRELMREKAFLVLPEWAVRWKTVFQHELGLSSPVARDFMQEYGRMLVYVDTGIIPVPRKIMEECADYMKLPWRVESVSLDGLLALLREAESRVFTSGLAGGEQ